VVGTTVPAGPAAAGPAGAGPAAGPVSGPPTGGPHPAFRAVRAGNAFEETVERLLQAIKLGLVRHGDRLPAERDLAVRLGVSRMTLREAIRDLQRAGYVESRRGRFGGTFVVYRPPVPVPSGDVRTIARQMGESLTDALAFRRVLEVGAVELAGSVPLSPEQRAYLNRRLAECAGAPAAEYRQHDSRLHLAIAELSGSASLVAAMADVRMRLNDLLDAIPLLRRNIRHSDAQHARIVAGILAGDPARARQAMEEHVDGTAALLRGFLG
jgi:GntR family transcriptional repressor for pyruvate dehydrogenase complex